MALNTAQNSSPMSRTILTGKRKIVAENRKDTNDNPVIPDNVTKSEKEKQEVGFNHVTYH